MQKFLMTMFMVTLACALVTLAVTGCDQNITNSTEVNTDCSPCEEDCDNDHAGPCDGETTAAFMR